MTHDQHPDLAGQRWQLLRTREGGTEVTTLELFFDLVYVFAISQMSHLLLDDFTWHGALETSIMLFAVWWAWIYTTWVTNWFDPGRTPIRLLLIGLMGASLALSSAIPGAFEDRGLWFALAYVLMQAGRSLFLAVALGNNRQAKNFWRITCWMLFAAPLWIAGGLSDGELRIAFWIGAIAVDALGPPTRFWTPWLGRSGFDEWDISAEHMAERAQLFIIISLGESIVLTGAALAGQEHVSATVWTAFAASFAVSVMMWWTYFSRAGQIAEIFEKAKDPGRIGRAFTLFHIPMIAGIIVLAVADELVIHHPEGHASSEITAALVGGGLLYLLGNALFNHAIIGRFPTSRVVAAVLVLSLIPIAQIASPVVMMILLIVPFLLVAALDANESRVRGDEDDAVQILRG